MKQNEVIEYIKNNIVFLDGATGTYLQKNGLKTGECPEQFVIENPHVIQTLQKTYVESGSDIVYACSFGANAIKLKQYGLQDNVYEMNKKLVQISKEVGAKFVAGDMGTTGQFLQPMGPMSFDQAVEIFKQQINGLVDGGADLIVIETMMDIRETRAAVIAAKEVTDIPVFVTMTFDENGRTLTGSSPKACAVTLQAIGADAVGMNCSTGPKEMVKHVADMKSVLNIPLIVKPNAGLPQLVNGETVFNLSHEDFADDMLKLCELGADVVGGCCGTDERYIKALKDILEDRDLVSKNTSDNSFVSSAFDVCEICQDDKLFVIGERINPTGKKELKEKLKQNDMSIVMEYAAEQLQAGADILDVNVGAVGLDEQELMKEAINTLSTTVRLPLCIDSSDVETVEAALRIYPGRAIINSISLEKDKAQKLLPLAKKYGAMFILLTIGKDGIPETGEERIEIINELYNLAKSHGLSKNDILVDGLAFAISSSKSAANETFKVIKWCKENGFKTVLGVSNSSFGLPQRKWINASYLTIAMSLGLTCAIINPCEELLMNTALSSAAVLGRDKDYVGYINGVSKIEVDSKKQQEVLTIYDAVLKGADALQLVDGQLKTRKIEDIINNDIIGALNKVGDLFAEKKYFLPQLLASASSAKEVLDYLEPKMLKEQDDNKQKEKFIIATVKGDVHDIGKNLAALMLKNHGYDVLDLGKDVDPNAIIDAVEKTGAKMVGLSALMTTTAIEMEKTIVLLKKAYPDIMVMVGGAVISKDYAESINADYYAKDALESVKQANEFFGR